MKNKQLTLQRVPLLLAMTMLSTALSLSACSNNEQGLNDTPVGADAESLDTKAIDDDLVISDGTSLTATHDSAAANKILNPAIASSDQPSLVTNPTEAGTPEDTVKQALNTLYYGEVKDAVGYYRVDMDNFEEELANTQSAFQQTVESVTLTYTQYSIDRVRATVTGELKLKGQSEPVPLTYQLRKAGNEWKILE